jgi:hypothetical protein
MEVLTNATVDEIKIDLDEADAAAAEKTKKKPKADPDEPIVEVAAPAPDPKPIVQPEDGLEKLKKQLDDEKNLRIAAERRADEASASEVAARTESQDNRLHVVTSAIATVTQANDVLETRYAESLQTQDFAAAAKIQREMATNAAKLNDLERGKIALEKAPKPTVRPPSDPVEQFVAEMTPQSAAWIRAHADYVTDGKKNKKMIAAHNWALSNDIAPDSPEYFASIERTLGLAKPEPVVPDVDPMAETAKPTVRRAPPAAAPVTRSGNGAGNRPNVVTLSSEEVEMAGMMGQTPEEYARNKIALKKEGRLN